MQNDRNAPHHNYYSGTIKHSEKHRIPPLSFCDAPNQLLQRAWTQGNIALNKPRSHTNQDFYNAKFQNQFSKWRERGSSILISSLLYGIDLSTFNRHFHILLLIPEMKIWVKTMTACNHQESTGPSYYGTLGFPQSWGSVLLNQFDFSFFCVWKCLHFLTLNKLPNKLSFSVCDSPSKLWMRFLLFCAR